MACNGACAAGDGHAACAAGDGHAAHLSALGMMTGPRLARPPSGPGHSEWSWGTPRGGLEGRHCAQGRSAFGCVARCRDSRDLGARGMQGRLCRGHHQKF